MLITITDNGKKKTSQLLAECKELSSVYCYLSDEQLDKDFPPKKTKFTYEMTQEPDEKWANKSWNDLQKIDVHFMELRERLIFQKEYKKKTGNFPDQKYITLCNSRDSDGNVPRCDWDDGKFWVLWRSPDCCDDDLRSRSAVSSSSLTPSDTLEVRVENLEKQMSDLRKFLIF